MENNGDEYHDDKTSQSYSTCSSEVLYLVVTCPWYVEIVFLQISLAVYCRRVEGNELQTGIEIPNLIKHIFTKETKKMLNQWTFCVLISMKTTHVNVESQF